MAAPRIEWGGGCLPTRILKSRIFKKYPAARFSSLTWLRSLDARVRIRTRAEREVRDGACSRYVCVDSRRYATIRVYPTYL